MLDIAISYVSVLYPNGVHNKDNEMSFCVLVILSARVLAFCYICKVINDLDKSY